jgi:hypothetical protein
LIREVEILAEKPHIIKGRPFYNVWDAVVQPGFGGFVQLNNNGGFYQQTVRNVLAGGGYGSNLGTGTIKAGDFNGGSLEYKITTVLHELAHLVGLPVSDKSGGLRQAPPSRT